MGKKKPLPQPPTYLLSIDPAAAAGWAFFKEGKPILWRTADGSKWATLYRSLLDVHDHLRETFRDTTKTAECVIEDGFMQYGKSTFKGALTLGRRRGLAQGAAEALGFEKFTYHAPSTWQNGLGWRRGIDTKVWSMALVKARFGIEDISHDVADAIALGAYHLDTFKEPA